MYSSPYPVANGSNVYSDNVYSNVLCTKLEELGSLKVSDIQDGEECIDIYINDIVNAMYSSAKNFS
jgi:hypothetical protein